MATPKTRKFPTTMSVLSELDSVRLEISDTDSALREILRISDSNNLGEIEAAVIASKLRSVMDKLAALARFVEGQE